VPVSLCEHAPAPSPAAVGSSDVTYPSASLDHLHYVTVTSPDSVAYSHVKYSDDVQFSVLCNANVNGDKNQDVLMVLHRQCKNVKTKLQS